MTKSQVVYQEMLTQNKELFAQFKKIHDQYAQDPIKFREEYNHLGEKVMEIIRRYESRLCGKSEKSGYGKFTGNLAEKFWNLIKQNYPLIEEIGLR